MIEGRLVRLRAFEQSDLDANHAFVNDYATLRDMLAGMPLPASYAGRGIPASMSRRVA